MNAALIVMTILGCNDGGTECHYITTLDQRWPTVAMCDSVSEQHLPQFANQPYPVIIAVCQNPQTAGVAEAHAPGATPPALPAPDTAPSAPTSAAPENTTPPATAETAPAPPVTQEEKDTLADRAIQRVRNVLPTTEGVKDLVGTPVRLVENGYSWVARRFDRSK